MTFILDESLRHDSNTTWDSYFFVNYKYLENSGVLGGTWNTYNYCVEDDGTWIPGYSLKQLLEASTTRKVRYNCYQTTTDIDPNTHYIGGGFAYFKDDGSGQYKVIVFIVDVE